LLYSCTSILSESILHFQDKKYIINDAFKRAIRAFGEYVLIFQLDELIYRLKKVQETHIPKFGYVFAPIIYRDLNRFDTKEYNEVYNRMGNGYDNFFVKSIDYKEQNEWRLLIGGLENPLKPTNGDSFSINIGTLESGHIFQSDIFLNTLKITTPTEV